MATSPKLYLLRFSARPGYLFADLKGETVSPSIIRDYVIEIVDKCDELKLDRVLLYRDIPAVLSAGSVFFTVSESLRAFAGKKIAIVNPHPSIDRELSFGVTVGQNRGGNYRTFDNEVAAEAWLLDG